MQDLISQGVTPDMVSAHGLGDTDPIAPNHTAQGRGSESPRRAERGRCGSRRSVAEPLRAGGA
jgi:outer membrane protein OmpA-like peptidoglycan-associated protein